MPGRREENAGKRMLKHLSAILEKSGVIIFEYHIKTDTLIRYNKELEVEVEIPKYCDYLRDKTRIYPDDRWKAIEFYSGRIKGPIDIREVDDDGYVSRKRLETVSIEEDEEEGRPEKRRETEAGTSDPDLRELSEECYRDPLQGTAGFCG